MSMSHDAMPWPFKLQRLVENLGIIFILFSLNLEYFFASADAAVAAKSKISHSVGEHICSQQAGFQESNSLQNPVKQRPENEDGKCGWLNWSKCDSKFSESKSELGCPSFELESCDEEREKGASSRAKSSVNKEESVKCWCQHLTGHGTVKGCNKNGPPDTIPQVKECSASANGCVFRYERGQEKANLRDCYTLDPHEEGCTTSAGETYCYCYGNLCNDDGLTLPSTTTEQPTGETETDPVPIPTVSSSSSTSTITAEVGGSSTSTTPSTATKIIET